MNRDKTTHLWLFLSILPKLKKEEPELFVEALIKEYREIITSHIKHFGNLRSENVSFKKRYERHDKELSAQTEEAGLAIPT